MTPDEAAEMLRKSVADAPRKAAEAQYQAALAAAQQIKEAVGMRAGRALAVQVSRTQDGAVVQLASSRNVPLRRVAAAPRWQEEAQQYAQNWQDL